MGRLSKELATILLDVPVTFDAKAYRLTDPDHMAVAKLLKNWSFAECRRISIKFFSTTKEVATTTDSLATEKTPPPTSGFDLFNQPELVQHLKKTPQD